MPVRCYGQCWYKYWIRIGVHVLICRNLRDRVVDGGGWSDRIRDELSVNNIDGPRTKSKIYVETLLALVIGSIDYMKVCLWKLMSLKILFYCPFFMY